ncbi:MAG: dienelactone hydrolase family protein [Rhodobacteraceae bacterium]|nr:dienelactone hydrolase family protein [Paracoccaceae bacterium]
MRLSLPFANGLAGAVLAVGVMAASLFMAVPASAGVTPVSIRSSAESGLALRGQLYRPAGSRPAPAVILMHGCGGWQPSVLRGLDAYAKFLVGEGFVVLNLDSFGPRGNAGGTVCQSLNRLSAARRYRTNDAYDAMHFLKSQSYVDSDSIFLIGQSNGGSVAMIAATQKGQARHARNETGFRGVVALYPWCGATGSRRPSLSAPLLILGGALDDWVPAKDCQNFNAQGRNLRVKVFPNAAHSFDIPVPVHRYLGKLVGYNPSAAQSARSEIIRFFRAQM